MAKAPLKKELEGYYFMEAILWRDLVKLKLKYRTIKEHKTKSIIRTYTGLMTAVAVFFSLDGVYFHFNA